MRFDIADFRNFGEAKLHPHLNGFNFLYGDNGSGKTSLIEAMYYLCRGRSFRSSTNNSIIHHSANKFSLFAKIVTKNQQVIPIGLERQRHGEAKIQVAGNSGASLAELAQLMPALLINSHCYHLLDAGPVFRRKYLDWGAFYLTEDFLRIWKRYERVLKQRNAALRQRASKKELLVWSEELITSGVQLDTLRQRFFQQLLPFLKETLIALIELPGLTLSYQRGWSGALSYEKAIQQSMDKDIYAGYTQLGPHRADFKIMMDEHPAKDILSRGQQKLFVCAMMVAQGALLQQCINRKPIYLIDDLPSELDSVSRSRLIALLTNQKVQVFLTAVERGLLEGLLTKIPAKMFHVEHGEVKEVS